MVNALSYLAWFVRVLVPPLLIKLLHQSVQCIVLHHTQRDQSRWWRHARSRDVIGHVTIRYRTCHFL